MLHHTHIIIQGDILNIIVSDSNFVRVNFYNILYNLLILFGKVKNYISLNKNQNGLFFIIVTSDFEIV